MLQILRTTATSPSNHFVEVARESGRDNVRWFGANDPLAPRETGAADKGVRVLLLGGRGHAAFRVRAAQAHARTDMTPSHWSHVALVNDGGALDAKTRVLHVPLEPPGGLSGLLRSNGVLDGELSDFASPELFPNVAVLAVPTDLEQVVGAAQRLKDQRNSTDLIELAVAWTAFVCGVGRTPVPLFEGLGLPAAVFVESIFAAVGVDLTPGLPNRASCPEALWQAAKWWHEYHAQTKGAALRGAWCVAHDLSDAYRA